MEKNRAPYGLRIIHSCLSCPVREEGLFCQLGPEALAELNAIRQTSVYPKGAVLFVEGQPCRGVFVLCAGKAKLRASSARGRSVIVRVAEPGEVLGLSAALSNTAYEVSAETLEPVQVNFLPREEFLRFLQSHGEVSVRVAQHLSAELRRGYHQLARIALAPTARAKLAGLLLDWAGRNARSDSGTLRFQLHLSHEEMAELIGSSRETVTRILSDFRRRGLLKTKGTLVTLPDPAKFTGLLT
ncbi:MAG: Crp/Fnr family transcriptional regulator [Terriglobia bacterium]